MARAQQQGGSRWGLSDPGGRVGIGMVWRSLELHVGSVSQKRRYCLHSASQACPSHVPARPRTPSRGETATSRSQNSHTEGSGLQGLCWRWVFPQGSESQERCQMALLCASGQGSLSAASQGWLVGRLRGLKQGATRPADPRALPCLFVLWLCPGCSCLGSVMAQEGPSWLQEPHIPGLGFYLRSAHLGGNPCKILPFLPSHARGALERAERDQVASCQSLGLLLHPHMWAVGRARGRPAPFSRLRAERRAPLCSLEMGKSVCLFSLGPLSCEVEGVRIVPEESVVGRIAEDIVPTLKKGREGVPGELSVKHLRLVRV